MASSNRDRESGLSRFFAGVKLATLVGLLWIAYQVAVGTGLIRSNASRSVPVQGVEHPEQLVARARGVTLGEPSARVTITEFGDFQCPACEYWTRNTKPQLDAAFVQTGQARLVFLDLPISSMHAHAVVAARAARCAEDQGEFWEYHDELFRQQPRWAAMPDPVDAFASYAETLQMDVPAFAECLASGKHADVVYANSEVADMLGVNSVPAVLVTVDGETRHAREENAATIARIIDEMTR
jgi:protein-disulfide isomerase